MCVILYSGINICIKVQASKFIANDRWTSSNCVVELDVVATKGAITSQIVCNNRYSPATSV